MAKDRPKEGPARSPKPSPENPVVDDHAEPDLVPITPETALLELPKAPNGLLVQIHVDEIREVNEILNKPDTAQIVLKGGASAHQANGFAVLMPYRELADLRRRKEGYALVQNALRLAGENVVHTIIQVIVEAVREQLDAQARGILDRHLKPAMLQLLAELPELTAE